jgi:hypothetical protein
VVAGGQVERQRPVAALVHRSHRHFLSIDQRLDLRARRPLPGPGDDAHRDDHQRAAIRPRRNLARRSNGRRARADGERRVDGRAGCIGGIDDDLVAKFGGGHVQRPCAVGVGRRFGHGRAVRQNDNDNVGRGATAQQPAIE